MSKLSKPYASQIEKDIFSSSDVTCVAGKWIEIGRKTSGFGEAFAVGVGTIATQMDAIGRLYMNLVNDAAGAYNGMVRFEIHDPQDNVVMKLLECRTEKLRTRLATPALTDMMPLPQMNVAIQPNSALVVMFNADAGDVLDVSACDAAIDITRYTHQYN